MGVLLVIEEGMGDYEEAAADTMQSVLEAFGLDADHTAVDVLMRQPVRVGLAVAHMMEHGDEPYEE